MLYVCPHYADPFIELIFEREEEAEQYARVYERVTGKEIDIEEREDEDEIWHYFLEAKCFNGSEN